MTAPEPYQHPTVIVSTSDRYHHLLPIFFYLYAKYWKEPFILLGHKLPLCTLPDNCTFRTMGPQTGPHDWSTGIRAYIESQSELKFFTWMMEDTLLKAPVDDTLAWALTGLPKVGRVNLTNDVSKREHTRATGDVLYASPTSRYRLSTQPRIWNREFFLQYMTPGLSPWEMETQDPVNDGWNVLGILDYPVIHNEGTTRHNIFKINTDGMCDEDLEIINELSKDWRQ